MKLTERAIQRGLERQNRPRKPMKRGNLARRAPENASHALKARRQRRLNDPELRAWSKAVRERDDYTCQMTGIRDVGRNVAHHRAPRSRRPDLRLNVENGVTLTPEAHQWVHDHPIEATKAGYLSGETYERARKIV